MMLDLQFVHAVHKAQSIVVILYLFRNLDSALYLHVISIAYPQMLQHIMYLHRVDLSAFSLQVQFSPRDFQAVMKLLDSMNDGKRVDESAGEEDKTSEVSPKDRDDEKKDEEVHEASAEEEQAAVSNIHVTANVAFIRLLLHSKEGQLADVKVEGIH